MIREFSPFFEENLVAGIKFEENSTWVDEFHIVEANRTFKYEPKELVFAYAQRPKIRYHKLNADRAFTGHQLHVRKRPPFVGRRAFSSVNEQRQRDYSSKGLIPEPNDILIFSDIDEIIDSRKADQIIDETYKHGVTTVRLHVTAYYLNLFADFQTGPPDFSYRVFAMTGKYFLENRIKPDLLRKMGEAGELQNTVQCLDGFGGFHHSWLGDSGFAARKMQAFAHGPADFDSGVYHDDGTVDINLMENLVHKMQHPMNESWKLQEKPDIPLLRAVEKDRYTGLAPYIL